MDNEKRATSLRRKSLYRQLLNRVEELQETDDVGTNVFGELESIFKEVDSIDGQCEFVERVEYADETLLETEVLACASGVLVKCIENVDIFDSPYEPSEFATKLLNEFKDPNEEEFQPTDWFSILEDVRKLVPELPNVSYLYGTFDPAELPVPKERKERAQREVQEKVEKKKLEKVVSIANEEGVDDVVNFLDKLLNAAYLSNESEPLLYYDFVIDSDEYGSTVENQFYTSFLVRDGKAKLFVGEVNVVIRAGQITMK